MAACARLGQAYVSYKATRLVSSIAPDLHNHTVGTNRWKSLAEDILAGGETVIR